MAQLYLMIPTGPVVPSTTTVLSNKYVLMVVQIPILAVLNSIDHSWLQVNKKRPGYEVLIISLVKEDVLPVTTLQANFRNQSWLYLIQPPQYRRSMEMADTTDEAQFDSSCTFQQSV